MRFCGAALSAALLLVTPVATSGEQPSAKHAAKDEHHQETHAIGEPVRAHPPLCKKCLLSRLRLEPGAIAKMPETCSKDGEGCASSMRCCDKSLSCYEKNKHWATCLPSCSEGIHFFSEWPWQWSSWGCRRLDFEIDEATHELNSRRVIRPLMYPRRQHEYEEFLDQRTTSGYLLPEAVLRRGFCKSAEICRKRCDIDRRCDCVVFIKRTNWCEKRRACDASALEDEKGTAVYLKVPGDGEQQQAYDRLEGTNLYNTEGKFVSEGKDVATGKRHPGDARYEDANISFHTCQRVCDLSKFCQCFVVSKSTGRCETYLDCRASRMISDSMYTVYVKVKPDAVEEEQETESDWLWLVAIIPLILVLCCLGVPLIRFCATWCEQGPSWGECLVRCGGRLRALFCCCCDQGARSVPATPGGKHYKRLPVRLTLGATLENAPSVNRWPGRCASCGCKCGRAPNWVPRSGAVICTEESRSGKPSDSMKLMPGDVVLQIGDKTVRRLDEVEHILDLCDEGEALNLRVLRPRKFGEYVCSRDPEASDPTLGSTLSQLDEVVKDAKPTHDDVWLQIVVRQL